MALLVLLRGHGPFSTTTSSDHTKGWGTSHPVFGKTRPRNLPTRNRG